MNGATSGALQVPEPDWADEVPRPLVAVSVKTTLTTVRETDVHRHRKAQLVLTLSGVISCEVGTSVWIVPPQCAVWIPSGQPHSVRGSGDLKIYFFYIEPNAATMPAESCTIGVSPLLRELLVRAASLRALYDLDGPSGCLVAVLLDQLAAAPVENLHFSMPRDPRLRKVADAMMADPAERLTIAEWGRRVGASERTLARILRNDTGMSFGRWRQQLHMLLALLHLAEGTAVQVVARALGYESASAFITMFRKALGTSPARYFAERPGSSGTAITRRRSRRRASSPPRHP